MSHPDLILLVEDNEDDVFLMRYALSNAGISNPLHVADDGEQAVAYLQGANEFADRVRFPFPAIMFLDLKMPLMSGFDVLAWMQARPHLPKFPVVVLSSSNAPADVERAARFNAIYAVKPPAPALFERIASELGFVWRRAPHPPIGSSSA